jgi:uncharacterized damage-inducible protein DinB
VIKSLLWSIAEQDEHIIAVLRKGEDTAELERKVADDLIKLNRLRNALSRRDNRLCLASENA